MGCPNVSQGGGCAPLGFAPAHAARSVRKCAACPAQRHRERDDRSADRAVILIDDLDHRITGRPLANVIDRALALEDYDAKLPRAFRRGRGLRGRLERCREEAEGGNQSRYQRELPAVVPGTNHRLPQCRPFGRSVGGLACSRPDAVADPPRAYIIEMDRPVRLHQLDTSFKQNRISSPTRGSQMKN